MADVYYEQTKNRQEFINKYITISKMVEKSKNKTILIKPNIVSYEPYPTTTHEGTLQSVVEHLQESAREVTVGDGSAFDCDFDILQHPLAQISRKLNVDFIDFSKTEFKNIKTSSDFDLEISSALFNFDLIVSLPVLKYNFSTSLTGALKNQFGFLSAQEKRNLHFGKKKYIHKAIAELSKIRKPDFYIVDAIQTMICAQECRHGGKTAEIGYMLAGTDPVSLDSYGFKLLSTVEKKLHGFFGNSRLDNVKHIKYAINLGIGDPNYTLQKL